MCGAEPAFPSFVISCGAAIRASRFGPAPSRVDMSPQQPLERRWERFRTAIPSPRFMAGPQRRLRASGVAHPQRPGEADRLSARIGTQAQCKQIGKTEGGLDVEPVVGFESDTDRECISFVEIALRCRLMLQLSCVDLVYASPFALAGVLRFRGRRQKPAGHLEPRGRSSRIVSSRRLPSCNGSS
jgi:hypothetical protein